MAKRIEAATLTILLCASLLTTFVRRGALAEQAVPEAASEKTVQAMFLNVGKADAALLALGDRRYLVDTGTKESAETLLRALAYFQVTHLDGVLITHTDADHVGGLKTGLPHVNRHFAIFGFCQRDQASANLCPQRVAS